MHIKMSQCLHLLSLLFAVFYSGYAPIFLSCHCLILTFCFLLSYLFY
uniref:Uncharacterized protein n=1 Tax=Rhizophora mucronata TaxID=61149 RepID=A0A2P2R599_RHIMU